MVPAAFDDVVPPVPAAHDSSFAAAPLSSSHAQFFSAIVPPLHSDSVFSVHVNPLLALVPQLPASSSPGGWRAGILTTLRETGVAFTAPVSRHVVSRNELRRLHTDMQHTHHVPHASETASRSASARPFRARRPPSSHEQPSSQPPASARLPSGLRTRPVIRRHVNACISAGATSDVPLPSPYALALPAASLLIRDPPPPSPFFAEAARLLASTASAVPPRTLPTAIDCSRLHMHLASQLMRITCTGVHAHAHRICTALLAVLLVHRTFAARVPIHVHHMHSACMHMHMLICDWLGGRERVRPSPLP